jgi:hypothetical protein
MPRRSSWQRVWAVVSYQRRPHSRRYRRQFPSPTSPRISLFSQARRRCRQYLLSYWACSITPCPTTTSRVRGAAETTGRARTLMPVVIIIPRTIDRIISSLSLTSLQDLGRRVRVPLCARFTKGAGGRSCSEKDPSILMNNRSQRCSWLVRLILWLLCVRRTRFAP